ncbi:MAG: hypothetical protein WAT93_12925 [Pontixanthobacter sp.]
MKPIDHKVLCVLEAAIALAPIALLVFICLICDRLNYLLHASEFSFAAIVISCLAVIRLVEYMSRHTNPARLATLCFLVLMCSTIPSAIILAINVQAHINPDSASSFTFPMLLLQLALLTISVTCLIATGWLADRRLPRTMDKFGRRVEE